MTVVNVCALEDRDGGRVRPIEKGFHMILKPPKIEARTAMSVHASLRRLTNFHIRGKTMSGVGGECGGVGGKSGGFDHGCRGTS